MKKRILLTAGGTATSWHFCNIIKKYFDDEYEIYITDTNDSHLVPSSIYAKKFFKVPSVFDKDYMKAMYEILEYEKIDIIIPLIDFDLINFSSDNKILKKLNVITTAPELHTTNTLSDKLNMYKFLSTNSIPTPKILNIDEVDNNEKYIIKPSKGFGSNGVFIKLGKEIKKENFENIIIQELCMPGEITVEIYNDEKLKIFQRERVATKVGVCTKMIPVHYDEIDEIIKNLVKIINCPKAFCVQFMKNTKGQWCIVDCNLRIGAGTALSSKIGFQLVRALLANLCNKPVKDEYFKIDNEIKSVLRVYEEIAIK